MLGENRSGVLSQGTACLSFPVWYIRRLHHQKYTYYNISPCPLYREWQIVTHIGGYWRSCPT